MTITIEQFKAADLAEIDLQDAQVSLRPHLPELGTIYEANGEAYTVRRDGRVVGCGGYLWTTLGAHLWAVLDRRAPLVALHRLALRAFSVYPDVRVTATCETTFVSGCRWLELLGFRRVAGERLGIHGDDHFVYVREARG